MYYEWDGISGSMLDNVTHWWKGTYLAPSPQIPQSHCCCLYHLPHVKIPAATGRSFFWLSIRAVYSLLPSLMLLENASHLTAHQGQLSRHNPSTWASQRPAPQGQFPGCHHYPEYPTMAFRNPIPTLLMASGSPGRSCSSSSFKSKNYLTYNLLVKKGKGKKYKTFYLILKDALKSFVVKYTWHKC